MPRLFTFLLSFVFFYITPVVVFAAEQQKPPVIVADPLSAGNILQLLLGMVGVVVLIIGLAWVFKRMGGLNTAMGKELRVVGGLSMGARERLVLVQVGEKQLLLGVAPGRIQTLYELQKPIENPAQSVDQSGSFAEKLAVSMKMVAKK